MKKYCGKSVLKGIAIGKIHVYEKDDSKVKRVHVKDTEYEKRRFDESREKAKHQLNSLYEKALNEVGKANAMIFEVHQMMLDDIDYIESVTHIIESQLVNAEYAVACTADNFAKMFSEMDDLYMKERAADVKDISNRIIGIMQGKSQNNVSGDEAAIIFADDLAPSETVQMDKTKVLAFVTRKGSANSHTAILARTMNIPALINVEYTGEIEGKTAIVDGYEGVVYIEPEEKLLQEMKEKQLKDKNKEKLLEELKGKENITRDGRKIKLYANIGGVSDVAAVLKNDAGGIGLFRSEFLYIGRNDFPTEEEQFNAYKTVAENMAGKKVIIRTLDIGADKQADYFNLEKEENPALGLRAIRICLSNPEIFKTQLRAIYRASAYGNISIMYPMIISVSEVKKIKEIANEVKAELDEIGITYGQVEQGVMIETPAAVMMSEELSREVDFFSIGTNDLTQYTLAIDRQNQQLEQFYDSHHPAVLKMIQMTVENGHKNGCWVGICGELAADASLTGKFIDMGVDELSVSPSMILQVRKAIREV